MQFLESEGYYLTKKLVRKCLSGLSAIADKTRILLTKSKDKLCHNEFLSRFLHPLKTSKLSLTFDTSAIEQTHGFALFLRKGGWKLEINPRI